MKKLRINWITEGCIDFEYKQYMLLAYLQDIEKQFRENKLYPYFATIIEHYKSLVKLKENKQMLVDTFPKHLKNMNINKSKLFYENSIENDKLMNEIADIIDYAIPKFEHFINEGKSIYDFVENKLHIYPIGIIPLHTNEGYVLLRNTVNQKVKVFEYDITIFEKSSEKYKGIHTQYITSYTTSLSCTFEYIKSDLIKLRKKMPLPATYMIESDVHFPFNETYFPIAKRKLVQYLTA